MNTPRTPLCTLFPRIGQNTLGRRLSAPTQFSGHHAKPLICLSGSRAGVWVGALEVADRDETPLMQLSSKRYCFFARNPILDAGPRVSNWDSPATQSRQSPSVLDGWHPRVQLWQRCSPKPTEISQNPLFFPPPILTTRTGPAGTRRGSKNGMSKGTESGIQKGTKVKYARYQKLGCQKVPKRGMTKVQKTRMSKGTENRDVESTKNRDVKRYRKQGWQKVPKTRIIEISIENATLGAQGTKNWGGGKYQKRGCRRYQKE